MVRLYIFPSVAEAQQIIEAWRVDYNTARPHLSLGQLTPANCSADVPHVIPFDV